jgi:hypothetical protein
LLKEGFGAQSVAVTHHLERGIPTSAPQSDQLTVLITIEGCKDQSAQAAQRFLGNVGQLSKEQGASSLAPHGFSFLSDQLTVSGRFTQQRLDVSVMGRVLIAPPALAAAAMAAFEGVTFRFHTAA